MEKEQNQNVIVLDDSLRAFLGEEVYQEMVEKFGEPNKTENNPETEHPKFTTWKNPNEN